MTRMTYGDLVADVATLEAVRAAIPEIALKTRRGVAFGARDATYAEARIAQVSRPMMTLTAAAMTERIGRNLRHARHRAELSQRAAGERLDPPVRRNEINRYEHGQRRPGEIRLLQFAALYDVDPGYFYTEHDNDEAAA